MATRLLAVFELFRASAATSAATRANSWAVICLWRKFFALQDEKHDEQVQMISDIFEDKIHDDDCRDNNGSSVDCPEIRHMRQEFVRDYYRNLSSMVGGATTATATATVAQGEGQEGPSMLAQLIHERQQEQVHRLNNNQQDLNVRNPPTTTTTTTAAAINAAVVAESMYLAQ